MSIADIVSVNITRETPVLTQVGFGTLMILGTHKVFNERIKFYSTIGEVQADGFNAAMPEFIAAQSVFFQNPRVQNIAIGRRSADNAVVTVDSAVVGADYVVTINAVNFSYTALMANSEVDIAAALVALVNAGAEPVTATDNLDGTFDLDADVSGVAYSVAVSANMSFTALSSDTVSNDMAALIDESDDFYGVMLTSRVEADVLAMAAFVEARLKLFGTASSDADMLTTATTDIASQLQALEYARTFVMYHDLASSIYPEAAWFGRQLPTAPGSSTWAFKSLTGTPVSNLTTNQRANVLNKDANTYEARAGANITREGKVAAGEYIDVIRGLDWLQTRMTERIFSTLVSAPKVPYTDAGVGIIEADVRSQLDQAVSQGVLTADPAFTVTVPLVRDVPQVDRANRFLPNVKFTATLAGAIHTVVVNGVISV